LLARCRLPSVRGCCSEFPERSRIPRSPETALAPPACRREADRPRMKSSSQICLSTCSCVRSIVSSKKDRAPTHSKPSAQHHLTVTHPPQNRMESAHYLQGPSCGPVSECNLASATTPGLHQAPAVVYTQRPRRRMNPSHSGVELCRTSIFLCMLSMSVEVPSHSDFRT
jgi:hypothetical protein